MTRPESQLTDTVLMIRPVRFESNPLTAESNAFMEDMDESPAEQQAAAAEEFEGVVEALEQNRVRVIVVEDARIPHTPDAVFPNNWVTFHADGRVVLYPMEAENRRTERRTDIIEYLDLEKGYHVSEVVDLSGHEDRVLGYLGRTIPPDVVFRQAELANPGDQRFRSSDFCIPQSV